VSDRKEAASRSGPAATPARRVSLLGASPGPEPRPTASVALVDAVQGRRPSPEGDVTRSMPVRHPLSVRLSRMRHLAGTLATPVHLPGERRLSGFGLRDGHVDRRPGASAGWRGRAHSVLEVAVDIRVQHLLILLGVISVGDDHVVAFNYEATSHV
jgi:hypothetical protein